jgi:hypothetical protein
MASDSRTRIFVASPIRRHAPSSASRPAGERATSRGGVLRPRPNCAPHPRGNRAEVGTRGG